MTPEQPSNGQVIVKLSARPRAQRKGMSPEPPSNGLAMVRPRQRPRAHRKGRTPELWKNGQIPPETRAQHEGRSPEQWKNGQIPPETRLAQGQVAGAASKNERLKRFAAIARIDEERKAKSQANATANAARTLSK